MKGGVFACSIVCSTPAPRRTPGPRWPLSCWLNEHNRRVKFFFLLVKTGLCFLQRRLWEWSYPQPPPLLFTPSNVFLTLFLILFVFVNSTQPLASHWLQQPSLSPKSSTCFRPLGACSHRMDMESRRCFPWPPVRRAIQVVSAELQPRATGRDGHEKGKIRSREERVSPRAHRNEWGVWPGELSRGTQASGLAMRNTGTQPSKVPMPESSRAARKGLMQLSQSCYVQTKALWARLSEKTTEPGRLSGAGRSGPSLQVWGCPCGPPGPSESGKQLEIIVR